MRAQIRSTVRVGVNGNYCWFRFGVRVSFAHTTLHTVSLGSILTLSLSMSLSLSGFLV